MIMVSEVIPTSNSLKERIDSDIDRAVEDFSTSSEDQFAVTIIDKIVNDSNYDLSSCINGLNNSTIKKDEINLIIGAKFTNRKNSIEKTLKSSLPIKEDDFKKYNFYREILNYYNR